MSQEEEKQHLPQQGWLSEQEPSAVTHTALPNHGQAPGVAEDALALFSHGVVTGVCWVPWSQVAPALVFS